MPHYKDHRLAGEDHEDVFLAGTVEPGDALVWNDTHVPNFSDGAHVVGIDPNLTDLNLDEEMMPIEFMGIWIPGPATSSGTGSENSGSRAFAFFSGT